MFLPPLQPPSRSGYVCISINSRSVSKGNIIPGIYVRVRVHSPVCSEDHDDHDDDNDDDNDNDDS
jgi:hypothetical protein